MTLYKTLQKSPISHCTLYLLKDTDVCAYKRSIRRNNTAVSRSYCSLNIIVTRKYGQRFNMWIRSTVFKVSSIHCIHLFLEDTQTLWIFLKTVMMIIIELCIMAKKKITNILAVILGQLCWGNSKYLILILKLKSISSMLSLPFTYSLTVFNK